MGSPLVVAGRPTNLNLPPGAKALQIDSDLFGICERIREISPNLNIILTEGDADYTYVIMEDCPDGQNRLIYRVKELDARVVEKLRYIMAVPMAERYAKLEREEYKLRQEQEEEAFEELYDRVGRPMWTQLEHDGFIQRNQSYAKRGVKATNGGK